MKKLPLIFSALFSAVLLVSCSSPANIRPEVAQPLDKARRLANGWSDKAAVTAKLNQAASVPNLSKDEQDQIRATTIYALARAGSGGGIPASESGVQREMTPQSSVNSTWPYR
jgi:hypothetical protein